MKVSKWGNSLAIRIPADVAAKLGIKEGDELEAVDGLREGVVDIRKKRTKQELRERLAEIRKRVKIPSDYRFDREEANSRGK